MKVYKYEIPPNGIMHLPKDAAILCVGNQGGLPFLWAEVDPKLETEQREIVAVPTGGEIPDWKYARYIGTVHGIEGWMVMHFYELKG